MSLEATKAAILAALEDGPLDRKTLYHKANGPHRVALRLLIESGEVVKIGATRGTKYALKEKEEAAS